MDINLRDESFDQIVYPQAKGSSKILQGLHLASFSSTSEIHEDIEKLLLSPPRAVPDYWLPSYQVFGGFFYSSWYQLIL